jgi:hypothetical protein
MRFDEDFLGGALSEFAEAERRWGIWHEIETALELEISRLEAPPLDDPIEQLPNGKSVRRREFWSGWVGGGRVAATIWYSIVAGEDRRPEAILLALEVTSSED